MAWTFDEKSPIYLQIAYRVKLKIASKELSMGQQLLPVREFAQEAGVNPNTCLLYTSFGFLAEYQPGHFQKSLGASREPLFYV